MKKLCLTKYNMHFYNLYRLMARHVSLAMACKLTTDGPILGLEWLFEHLQQTLGLVCLNKVV